VFALLGHHARAREAGGRRAARGDLRDGGLRLTSLLLRAAAAAARETGVAPRFVYLSSAGVSAGARGAYLAVRWRMEQELRASGLPFVIARPGFITGPTATSRAPSSAWAPPWRTRCSRSPARWARRGCGAMALDHRTPCSPARWCGSRWTGRDRRDVESEGLR
jgi:uncharacterized protein YbjT (DUF2867 family)